MIPTSRAQDLGRMVLSAFLLFAGVSHLAWARVTFQAQVPDWVPVDANVVVILSGFVEIGLGLSLLFVARYRTAIGWIVAAFFVAVFPGNVSQFLDGDAAFGLDSDLARGVRLVFQPVLIAWALWCTGAWSSWRADRRAARRT